MGMNFPDLPALGDVFGPYEWDGEKWVTTSTGGGDGGSGGIDQTTADARYVNVTGDTMTGELTLPWLNTATGIGGGPDGNALLVVNPDETVKLYSPFAPTPILDIGPFGEMDVTHNGKSHKFGNEVGYHYATLDEYGLQLPISPTLPMHAATKQYVDDNAGGGGGGAYLPLTGGTLTGPLALPENAEGDYAPSLSFGPTFNSGLAFAAVDDIPSYQGLFVLMDGRLKASFYTNGPTAFYGQMQLPRDEITAPPYTFSAMYSSGLYGSEPVEGQEIVGISIKTLSKIAVGENDITTTVPIVLPADPTAALHAVTKQYVDAIVITGGGMPDAPSDGKQYARQDANWSEIVSGGGGGEGGAYLPLEGGTLTGPLVFPATGAAANNMIHFGTPGTGIYGDTNDIFFAVNGSLKLNVFMGGISTLGNQITNTALPLYPEHLANKRYVDEQIAANMGGGGAGGDYLPLTGGTLTGPLSFTDALASPATTTINFGTPATGFYGGTNYIAAAVSGVQKLLLSPLNLELYVPKLSLYDGGSAAGVALGFGAGNTTGLWGSSSEMHIASGGINRITFDDLEGVLILQEPTLPRHPTTKQYVDAIAIAGGNFVDAPIDGQQYARQDAAWTVVAAGGGGGGDYLPLTGGTLTGDLSATGYLIGLNKFAMLDTAANRVTVWGTNAAKETLRLGIGSNEYFADVHSFKASDGMATLFIASKTSGVTYYKPVSLQADPQQPLHAATKQYVDAQVAAGGGGASGDYLPLTGGIITGDLYIDKHSPLLMLNSTDASTPREIIGGVAGIGKWYARLGDAYGNFELGRCDASGVANLTSLLIDTAGTMTFVGRADFQDAVEMSGDATVGGMLTLGADPTVPLGAATKQYVDAVAGGGGGGGEYLPLTGGMITGDLAVFGMLSSPTVYAKTLTVDGPDDYSTGGWIALDRWEDGLVAEIVGRKSGVRRWDIVLGNADPDGFPNENWAGSNFEIASYDNFGRNRDINFKIDRYTGKASVGYEPSEPMGIATKNYVDVRLGMIHVKDTKPQVQENVLWWDNVEGQLYIQVYDIDYTYQWVQAVPDPYYMLKTTGGVMTGDLVINGANLNVPSGTVMASTLQANNGFSCYGAATFGMPVTISAPLTVNNALQVNSPISSTGSVSAYGFVDLGAGVDLLQEIEDLKTRIKNLERA